MVPKVRGAIVMLDFGFKPIMYNMVPKGAYDNYLNTDSFRTNMFNMRPKAILFLGYIPFDFRTIMLKNNKRVNNHHNI